MESRTLQLLNQSCAAAAQAGGREALFRSVDQALGELVGHKLFTILYTSPDAQQVIRVYSNQPQAYPVSGAKKMGPTPWGDLVIDRGEPYIGKNADDIKWAFFDHELIASLGCESVLNIPVVVDGQTLGTLNLLHEAAWYEEKHVALATPFAYLLAPVFEAVRRES
jgi:transcriptional regulator with GAF, ATPase, and Fis domain